MKMTWQDFCDQNQLIFEDLERQTGRLFEDIAADHYKAYEISIEDRDND
jgi:hypothetical protein